MTFGCCATSAGLTAPAGPARPRSSSETAIPRFMSASQGLRTAHFGPPRPQNQVRKRGRCRLGGGRWLVLVAEAELEAGRALAGGGIPESGDVGGRKPGHCAQVEEVEEVGDQRQVLVDQL